MWLTEADKVLVEQWCSRWGGSTITVLAAGCSITDGGRCDAGINGRTISQKVGVLVVISVVLEIVKLVNVFASTHNTNIGGVDDRCCGLSNSVGPGNKYTSMGVTLPVGFNMFVFGVAKKRLNIHSHNDLKLTSKFAKNLVGVIHQIFTPDGTVFC